MERLRHRADFLAAASGVKAHAGGFVLQSRRQPAAESKPATARVGFTVSRKVGNSVIRNRVRRRLREIVRLAQPSILQDGCDYVLIGRRAALGLPFEQLAEDFGRAVRRVHGAASDAGAGAAPIAQAGQDKKAR